jgi:hypothetical protein
VSERTLSLSAIVAGIMEGGQFMVNGFIHLDATFFQILLEQIVNAEELDTFIGIPFLQTKPGRIICVPSFG